MEFSPRPAGNGRPGFRNSYLPAAPKLPQNFSLINSRFRSGHSLFDDTHRRVGYVLNVQLNFSMDVV